MNLKQNGSVSACAGGKQCLWTYGGLVDKRSLTSITGGALIGQRVSYISNNVRLMFFNPFSGDHMLSFLWRTYIDLDYHVKVSRLDESRFVFPHCVLLYTAAFILLVMLTITLLIELFRHQTSKNSLNDTEIRNAMESLIKNNQQPRNPI